MRSLCNEVMRGSGGRGKARETNRLLKDTLRMTKQGARNSQSVQYHITKEEHHDAK